jgi:hypothetical protein
MKEEKRFTANRAGWWFLIEKDPYEADEYVFRSVLIMRNNVGQQFHQNCIHAYWFNPKNMLIFGGRFKIPKAEIDKVIQEASHANDQN